MVCYVMIIVKYCNPLLLLTVTVAVLSFDQPTYSIIEDTGLVQPTLVLSRPLFTNTTVLVSNTDINATGNFVCM